MCVESGPKPRHAGSSNLPGFVPNPPTAAPNVQSNGARSVGSRDTAMTHQPEAYCRVWPPGAGTPTGAQLMMQASGGSMMQASGGSKTEWSGAIIAVLAARGRRPRKAHSMVNNVRACLDKWMGEVPVMNNFSTCMVETQAALRDPQNRGRFGKTQEGCYPTSCAPPRDGGGAGEAVEAPRTRRG